MGISKLVRNKINRRPREKLGFQPPSKIFYASLNEVSQLELESTPSKHNPF
jgi:hypothetical protein